MFAVPAATPVTMPVADPTVATVASLLLHVPGPAALVRAMVAPAHTVPGPVNAPGAVLTTKVANAAQPLTV